MHCRIPPSTPKCSLYARTLRKTHHSMYDTLGPFPDEPLMSSIDRVLFLFGGRKVQAYFNPEDKCSCSSCSYKSRDNRSSGRCDVKESPTYSVIQKPKCPKCDTCSEKCISFRESSLCKYSATPTISVKANSCRQETGKIGIPLRALKKSFSLCSLACRKIKETFSIATCESTGRSYGAPKWLWTKVENYADGCQVYEVFKNSCAATHPTKFDTLGASKIIFVILPTGIIMPFETIPRH